MDQVAAPAPEATPEAAQPEEYQQEQPAQDESMSRKLEMIAKREREFLSREQSWKQKLRQQQDMERRLQDYESESKMFEIDPMAALQKRGWDVNKLAEHIAGGSEPIQGQEKHKLYSELTEMKGYIKKLEESLEQRDHKQVEEKRTMAKKALYSDLRSIAERDSEKYELVNQAGAYDYVYEVLEAHYSQTGKPMALEDAMDRVENYLDSEYSKVLSYNKIKTKVGGEFQSSESKSEQPASYSYNRPSTLSSNFTQTTPPQSQRPLSREESLARAAKLLRFKE